MAIDLIFVIRRQKHLSIDHNDPQSLEAGVDGRDERKKMKARAVIGASINQRSARCALPADPVQEQQRATVQLAAMAGAE